MITLQLLQQIIVFFLMMACGFSVVKCGLIDAKSSRTLSVICIYIIMPCVMINAFQIEYSRSIRNGFLLAIAAAVLIHIFLLVFTQIIGKPLKLSVVEKESIIYSNPACDRSPWRGMGNLCQRFPECTDDPDVDPRTVTDGGEGRN